MSEQALTVTALTKYIKYKFDSDVHLKDVLLEGEISNFKKNVRGHFYFTLKDKNAAISAVMFKGDAWKVKFNPEDGMDVLIRGYISVFEISGSYQIYVKNMEQKGLGNLYQAYLELKDRLEKEGLFLQKYKKPLPKFPKQIAVLTSSTGAAVRDIIHIINRRYPLVKVLVYPTTVQGENAQYEIVENLKQANENVDNDCIILGRGGGSIEDLWAFNEERVARAIFDSKIPVISAVGHETDFTIADFVSDVRAPTPSGAAELAVPDQVTLHRDLDKYRQRMIDTLRRSLLDKKKNLKRNTERYVLKDPSKLLMNHNRQFENLYDKLQLVHPKNRLKSSYEMLNDRIRRLERIGAAYYQDKTQMLKTQTSSLDYVNPLSIMKKGYTLTKKEGKIIKSIQDVQINDTLEVYFHDGKTVTKVLKKAKDE